MGSNSSPRLPGYVTLCNYKSFCKTEIIVPASQGYGKTQ